jgi:hypothetical protein
MKAIMILSLIFSIVGEALYEGLYDNKRKNFSKLVQLVWIANFFFIGWYFPLHGYPFMNLVWVVASYSAFRYAFLSFTYNKVRHLPLFYYGKTSLSDRIMRTVHPSMIAFTTLIAILCGIFWIINEVVI